MKNCRKFKSDPHIHPSVYAVSFFTALGKSTADCHHLFGGRSSGGPKEDERVFLDGGGGALWARLTKNPDCSTGPLARPFARSLAPLTSFTSSFVGKCKIRCLKMTWFCPIVRRWQRRFSSVRPIAPDAVNRGSIYPVTKHIFFR